MNDDTAAPEMTRDERQLDMWKRWQKEGDEGVMTDLLSDLQPLIKSNLGQYSSSPLPYEVLRLRANVMLRDALSTYDPNKGASLGTYATHSMKPMSRYVQKYQNTKYLPQYLAQQYGRYENAEAQLRDKLGRDPDDEELSRAMNLSVRNIQRIRLAKSPEMPVSVSEEIGSEQSMGDAESSRNRDRLFYLRTTLKGKDRQMFDMLTGMGKQKAVTDRAEIARRLGVPVDEVYAKTRKWSRQVK